MESLKLPFELLIPILESAAAADRRLAYSLCLVASWTQPIGEKRLYATITLDREGDAKLFTRWIAKLAEDDEPSVQAQLVRRLSVYTRGETELEQIDPNLLVRLLRLCPNLQSIAWIGQFRPFGPDTVHLQSRLRKMLLALPVPTPGRDPGDLHLTTNFWVHRDVESSPVECTRVVNATTHLRVCGGGSPFTIQSTLWGIVHCHNLTHVSFTYHHTSDLSTLTRYLPDASERVQMIVLEVASEVSTLR